MSVRGALEARLKLLLPALPTAWENIKFDPPSDEDGPLPYQQAFVMLADPEYPVQGIGHRDQGFLQVSLFYPANKGTGDAEARAKLIRDHFPKKLALVHGGVVVTINNAAAILNGRQDGDRWMVPVRIPFHTNIQR